MARATAAAVVLPEQGSSSGRYALGEQLAVGGMGVIFRAYDRLADRPVAYKRLLAADGRARARLTALFRREYDVLSRLPHPNIVEVYDYGVDAAGPFYAMELLSGADLSKLAPLPYREACRLLRDIASALALVHARGLLHRDVSPNNVRLTSDGRAKLLDFGGLTPMGKTRELVGTPAFMAPECIEDVPLDQRSDLYSLGALAYWTLTRRPAVRAHTLEELPEALARPPVAPSAHVPELPRELDDLVLSLLARDQVARPASAAQVIERLTSIAELAPEQDEQKVAYSYLAQPPLFGRSEVLARLEQTADAARAGAGSAMLVRGAAGLGRSALMDAVAMHAQLSGATVLRARGDRSAGPFGLANQLVQLALVLYPDLEDTLRVRESFQTFLPGGGGQGRAGPTAMEVAERHTAVVANVVAALLEMSQRNPAVLVVDDVDASDPQSLALLASLVEELRGQRLAVVASAIAGEMRADTPAFAVLEANSAIATLAPLAEIHTIALFERLFGGAPNSLRLARWLHEQSGGVPAIAMDLARSLLARGVIKYTLGTFTLPHDVSVQPSDDGHELTLARLAGLGSTARAMAELLSLHDGWLTLEQLATAAELSTREVLLSLEELLARGVALQGAEGFTLLGGSLRAALERRCDRKLRGALHVRLARALLDHQDGTLDLRFAAATHLLRGGEEDEAAALVAEATTGNVGGAIAARWVELFERVLINYRRHRRSEEQLLTLLIPLGLSGFWGSLSAQRRHLEPALALLSKVCGMTLARKLRPYVGPKLALIAGMLYAAGRRTLKSPRERLGDVRSMIADFIALVTTGIAAAASAMEGKSARRIAALLDPLEAMPKTAPAYLAREFALATAEVGSGALSTGSARYAALLPHLENPMDDFKDSQRLPLYHGALNGKAQAEATDASRASIPLAEKLLESDPFFAPHAECALMTYYGHRGEQAKADEHRARAELLALRGGTSWSAVTLIAVRRAYIAGLTFDAIGLMQSIAELERLAEIAPNLGLCRRVAEAWLAYLRGRPEQAVVVLDALLDLDEARYLAAWPFNRALHAVVLNESGDHARAKQACHALLTSSESGSVPLCTLGTVRGQAALAEAGLGNLTLATELLDRLVQDAQGWDTPLVVGCVYRDRARLALLARDAQAFDESFANMEQQFRRTANASLLRLCEELLGEAQRAGLRSGARTRPSTAGEEMQDLDGNTVLEVTNERSTIVRGPSR